MRPLPFRPAISPLADADTQLMMRVRNGDVSAFEFLVGKHQPSIIHFLFGFVRERAVAEELSQEVFLRLYLTRERYEPTAKFSSWVYLIARNLAFNWLRDHRRERSVERIDAHRPGRRAFQLTDHRADLLESLQQKTRSGQIMEAIEQLPERQRVAVMMHKLEGHCCLEIAASMQCTDQAVRSLLFRAYAALRESLEPAFAPECQERL